MGNGNVTVDHQTDASNFKHGGEIVLKLTGNVWLSQDKIKDHQLMFDMDVAGVRVHMKQTWFVKINDKC